MDMTLQRVMFVPKIATLQEGIAPHKRVRGCL